MKKKKNHFKIVHATHNANGRYAMLCQCYGDANAAAMVRLDTVLMPVVRC